MATSFVLGRSFTSTYRTIYASASELPAALLPDHFEKPEDKGTFRF
jgi:hypothetical protein